MRTRVTHEAKYHGDSRTMELCWLQDPLSLCFTSSAYDIETGPAQFTGIFSSSPVAVWRGDMYLRWRPGSLHATLYVLAVAPHANPAG
ncbi:hypothetical protein MRX96_042942 [Rhipicephalus microplus]